MSSPQADTPPRVVVIGGGFAGIEATRALRKSAARVTLVDQRNHHLFQPLLYQVATAGLSPADIASPIRRIFRNQKNVSVLLAEVVGIDTDRRVVRLPDAELEYDYLVIGAGAAHSYFGRDEWSAIAPGLKTLDDATEIRRRILLAFERAEHEPGEAARRAALTFAIVGAGATGVELAGAIKEIAAQTFPRDFRNIDTRTARVVLIEGADRVLPGFHPALSDRAKRDLERLGVEVRLNTFVTDLAPGVVTMGQQTLEAGNVLWAAGVQASPLGASLGVPLDRTGRVLVEPDLSIPGHPEVFVAGDMAAVPWKHDEQGKQWVPGVAQGALQGGRHAGRVIAEEISSGRRHPARPAFEYHDKGSMAAIGLARAVAEVGRFRIGGLLAWLLWGVVHIAFLIAFRNRLAVMFNWIWSWISFTRSARLIMGNALQRSSTLLSQQRGTAPGAPRDEPPPVPDPL